MKTGAGVDLKALPPENLMTDSGYYSQGVRSRSDSGTSQSSMASSETSVSSLETSMSSSDTSVSSFDTSVTSSCCDDCFDKKTVREPEVYFRAREEIHDDESWIVVDIKKFP